MCKFFELFACGNNSNHVILLPLIHTSLAMRWWIAIAESLIPSLTVNDNQSFHSTVISRSYD